MTFFCRKICIYQKKAVPLHPLFANCTLYFVQLYIKESCLSGRKSRTRNAVYALRRIGGSNPSLSA